MNSIGAEGSERATVRVVHHLARTGGTVICKCLAVMPRVVLLSEVHPLGMRWFNPLKQAGRWYGLVGAADLDRVRGSGGISFLDSIELVRGRCQERGLSLVVRDWPHLDFHGVPYLERPTGRLLTAERLATRYRVVRIATVRHPIDQWLSVQGLEELRGALGLEAFLRGCAAFAEEAARIGFVRYEDFAREPERWMREICEKLELGFDPGFLERWSSYANITGDRAGGRVGTERIAPAARRPVDPALLETFERNADYRRTIEVLGYAHPGP